MTTTAAFYIGDRTFEVREVPPVSPGPGEVRIDVAYTGICGTDLHVLHGAMDHRVQPPGVIGHEMSGRVAELGGEVTDWSVGQAVTVMPLLWCGRCAACRAGHQHVCQRLTFVGIDSPGAMQSSWTVPADLLVAIPETLPLRHGALIEPTAVAVHDVRRSRLAAGEHAVVIGAGPVGLLIAAVARTVGAPVLLAELDAHRRAVGTAMGFTVVDPAADDLAGSVEQWTAGAGAAVVFEVSGSAAGVRVATDLLAVRGRLVVVAIHATPLEVDLHRIFWRELEVLGVRVYHRADFTEAVRLLAAGEVPAEELISKVVPLSAVPEAFAALEDGGGVVKVLIECGGGE
jgi:(R,R)-butanediol dehydrogenase/meso-butanediol dehydrogenase/diacetyl reductase